MNKKTRHTSNKDFTDFDKKEIGKRLQLLRKSKRLTVEELQKLKDFSNMDRMAISLLENGKRLPTLSQLRKYARNFNVTTDYILGLQNEKYGKTCIEPDKQLGFTENDLNILRDLENKKLLAGIETIIFSEHGEEFLRLLKDYLCLKGEMFCKNIKINNEIQYFFKTLKPVEWENLLLERFIAKLKEIKSLGENLI